MDYQDSVNLNSYYFLKKYSLKIKTVANCVVDPNGKQTRFSNNEYNSLLTQDEKEHNKIQ